MQSATREIAIPRQDRILLTVHNLGWPKGSCGAGGPAAHLHLLQQLCILRGPGRGVRGGGCRGDVQALFQPFLEVARAQFQLHMTTYCVCDTR